MRQKRRDVRAALVAQRPLGSGADDADVTQADVERVRRWIRGRSSLVRGLLDAVPMEPEGAEVRRTER